MAFPQSSFTTARSRLGTIAQHTLYIGVALLLFMAASVSAGPSTTQPYHPIEVFSGPQADAWCAAAADLEADIQKAMEPLTAWSDSPQLHARPNILAVSRIHVSLLRLARLARRLRATGETAGIDFELRAAEYARLVRMVGLELAPHYSNQIAKARLTLATKCKRHQKELAQTIKLIDAGEPEQTELRFYSAYDDLELIGFWFPAPADREETIMPFDHAASRLERARTDQLRAATDKELARRRSQLKSGYDALLTAMNHAVSGLSSAERVTFEGEQRTGPEILARFGDRWQELQIATLRCQAIDWARYSSGGKQANVQLREAFEEFSAEAEPALRRLIGADAKRVTREHAPALYARYVEALAPLLARVDVPATTQRFKSALHSIVEKSPPLASEISGYRAASDDLLRWRKRAAELKTRLAREEYEPMVTPPTPLHLAVPSSSVVRSVGGDHVGRRIRWNHLWGSSDNNQSSSGYTVGAFASVELPPELGSAADELRTELLAETAMPLTLEAAVALAGCKQGNLNEIGGEIAGIELASLIELFATLDDRHPGFTKLGPLPTEPVGQSFDPQPQVRARILLQPKWLRHEYVFVELP